MAQWEKLLPCKHGNLSSQEPTQKSDAYSMLFPPHLKGSPGSAHTQSVYRQQTKKETNCTVARQRDIKLELSWEPPLY